MADYAIGLSFHKSHRTVVRTVELQSPKRLFATRDSAGMITLPDMPAGKQYVELQGIRQTSFQVSDQNNEFRLLGDDGWSDSLITGSGVQASVTAYFLKNTEIDNATDCPVFRSDYEEGFALIQQARYNKDFEIYVEFLKEITPQDGLDSDFIYDFTGFNAVVTNYQESINPENLTEVSFDLMSRGRPVFGRYNAGSTPLVFGGIQTGLLFLEAGSRQVAVSPASSADSVAVDSPVTLTYTSDGSAALTQLVLGQTDGGGFRLEDGATGARVPVVVTLASNVVTITPESDLAAATIYRLIAADGALQQSVDGTGAASPTGIRTDVQGITTTFKTA